MKQFVLYSLLVAMLLAIGCQKEESEPEDEEFPVIGDDDDSDDDVFVPPGDDDSDDDSTGDDDNDDDSDDDGDDDTDDDADDDTVEPEAHADGWVLGESRTGAKPFAGRIQDGVIETVLVPDSGNVVLHAMDFADEGWGVAVGWNTNSKTGVAYKIQDDEWTAIPIDLPTLLGEWELRGVDVLAPGNAYIVGRQTVSPLGTIGLILHYQNGFVARMTIPNLSTNFRLNAIAMANEALGWAVGQNVVSGKGVILNWDGTDWEPSTYTLAENEVEFLDVVAVSNSNAFAVGSAKPSGEIHVRGIAMRYSNLTWQKSGNFPEDGESWRLSNLNAQGQDDVVTFTSKFNKMEHWHYVDGAWDRRSYGFDLPADGFVTGASLVDFDNGLVGFASATDNAGLVFERIDGVWFTVDPYPDNMGRIKDVFTFAVE
ncbi:MAG: hypothetical protein KJ042_05945 [Deltaproteobacteria bacterium]|nr:hypothetical protein [Deltaproteobacteria bacterium]